MSRKLLGAVGVVIAVLVASLAGPGAADAHGKRREPRPGHLRPRRVGVGRPVRHPGAAADEQRLSRRPDRRARVRLDVRHQHHGSRSGPGSTSSSRSSCARPAPTGSTCWGTRWGPPCRRGTSPARPSAPPAWRTTSTSTAGPRRRHRAASTRSRCGVRATRPARSSVRRTTTRPTSRTCRWRRPPRRSPRSTGSSPATRRRRPTSSPSGDGSGCPARPTCSPRTRGPTASRCRSSRSTAAPAGASTGARTPPSRSARTAPGARSRRTPASATSSR